METHALIPPRRGHLLSGCVAILILFTGLSGCINQPQMLAVNKRKIIDRSVVEYPSGFVLVPVVEGLDQPTAIAFDSQGSLLVAESGIDGSEPHIFGYHRDGSYFNIYPYKRTVSFYPTGFVMYGPINGMVAYQGKIYVSHRDRQGKGVITALGYDGSHSTIVADLPAQGDYGVTDLLIRPGNGRLYFGVGTATNSGVVGVDNWNEGWLKKHPDVHDIPYRRSPNSFTYLLGRRFDTINPWAGLFGGTDIAVTAPFQPFDVSNQTKIPGSIDKPNGAIFSVNPDGGDLRVEASGIHNPRGLGVNEYDVLYMTNDGMELRGTRPVKDDPDAFLRIGIGVNYGWPDYTTDCHPVSDKKYQPPEEMLIKTGYPDLSFIIDHDTSGLHPPDPSVLVSGTFPSLSGAAKFDFVPPSGPFKQYRGNAIVALSGDRAPFATSGRKLNGPVGFQVDRVDLDSKSVTPFIRNVGHKPASMMAFGTVALERPIDVKFGPDGALYILDFGRMDNKNGVPRFFNGTGRIFKLISVTDASTRAAQ